MAEENQSINQTVKPVSIEQPIERFVLRLRRIDPTPGRSAILLLPLSRGEGETKNPIDADAPSVGVRVHGVRLGCALAPGS